MTAAFGEVINSDVPTADASPSQNGEPQQLVDPNDPRLTSENLTIDPALDAYAVAPTPPDGKWRVKAKSVDIKDDKGQQQRYAPFIRNKMNGGNPFFATNVEYSLIDHSGEFDGVKMTDYWIKTSLEHGKAMSQATTLIGKLGGRIPTGGSQLDHMNALLAELAKEPEMIIETAWSAECMTCAERAKAKGEKPPRAFLQGMHRFPAGKTPGSHDPVVTCPNCKSQVRAQARIVRGGYYSLKETQATRGTGTAGGK